jgi:RND family efflux transporter MFP subunit
MVTPNIVIRCISLSFIAGVVAYTTAGCSKKEETQEPVVTVQVAIVERGKIEQVISTQGVLFPKDQAAITPKISAPVRAFYVNRGTVVHRGQPVATLENRDLVAAEVENKGTFEQAQAAYGIETSSALPEEWQKAEYDLKAAKEGYDAEQKVYQGRKTLFEQGALPRKDFDQASVAIIQAKAIYEIALKHLTALETAGKKNQLKSAKAQLTSAEGKYEGAAAQLSYSEITSPINGVVTERPLYPGETAAAGTPLLVIMDTSSVIARAHIPQSDAVLLKPGDSASIGAPGDIRVDGKVTLVSPALDPNSTTVEIWVAAPNPDGRLRPGTIVNVQMVAKSLNDAIVIPAAALLKTPEGANTVMVVGSDERAHQTNVEPGIRAGDQMQIAKGLSGGEKVIATGAYGLPDNTKVKIAEPAPTPETEKPSSTKDKD